MRWTKKLSTSVEYCLRISAIAIFALGMQAQAGNSATVSAGSPYQAIPLITSTGDFAVHFQAVFSAGADQGIALTSGFTQHFSNFAVTIRAYGDVVQARSAYGYPSNGFSFDPSTPVDFIVAGNVAQRTYSAWMAGAAQPYVQIARGQSFRAGASPSSLDTLTVWADAGTISVSLVDGICSASTYNQIVLSDHPVAYWGVSAQSNVELDLTGNGNKGTYVNGIPAAVPMPNGDVAADFNGKNQYLTIPSPADNSLSISKTGNLTLEYWIRPDTLQFPNETSDGYVAVSGKCENYSPTCEWELRMYSLNTSRPNRISGYAFNPSANLGSGADWQPATGVIQAGQWLHVVVEYTLQSQPSNCPNASAYPGSINIWVNGVEWNQADHHPTGCMSQFGVRPQPGNSPVVIGSMAFDSWFAGAVGKVAAYDYLLNTAQIAKHYQAMTGKLPAGNCADTCTF